MSKDITIAYISRNTKKLNPHPKEDYQKKVYYLRDTINYGLAGLSKKFQTLDRASLRRLYYFIYILNIKIKPNKRVSFVQRIVIRKVKEKPLQRK